LLGGADFGAGIIETFAGSKGEGTVSRAIAPVWEANHVWLILAVVILFTAFPSVYSSLSLVTAYPTDDGIAGNYPPRYLHLHSGTMMWLTTAAMSYYSAFFKISELSYSLCSLA
jgi:hypothetical protein